jgi:hypothetical protein
MATPSHIQRWVPYEGAPQSHSQVENPNQKPPERYDSPAWGEATDDDEEAADGQPTAQPAEEEEEEETGEEAEEEDNDDEVDAVEQAEPSTKPPAKSTAKPRKKPRPKAKAPAQRIHLTEEEHLTLLRLCNRHAESWRTSEKKV